MHEGNIVIPELVAWLLLGVLVLVLVLLFLFTATVLHLSRRRRLGGTALLRQPEEQFDGELFRPARSFAETPARWLAIRSTRPEEVQKAIGLADPTPCTLAEGLGAARDHYLFISPPIRGWIIVTGNRLPDPADDVDDCFLQLRKFSEQLGEVQFFSVNRALSIHSWARFLSGEVFRAFAWAGTTIWTQGELTRAEKDLGMRCPAYGDEEGPSIFATDDDPARNADKVAPLAARWSIDPARIDTERPWPILGTAEGPRQP